MSDAEELPEATSIRARWPGLIWAIPLAALIIVAFLGLRALSHRGVSVVVTFPVAEGVTVGDTRVVYHGVQVGHVTGIRVADDHSHVDVKLLLERRSRPFLTSTTLFWLIGEKPNLGDLQSVKSAIVGLMIGVSPGRGGVPTRHFVGLEEPPLILPGTPGRGFFLVTHELGTVAKGAVILYRGQPIGRVVDVGLDGVQRFRLSIFVNAPFDRLVRPGAEFWQGSLAKVSLSGGALQTSLSSPSSLFQGSVEFDLPADAAARPPSPAGASFGLYETEDAAAQGELGPGVAYRVRFGGTAGDIVPASPVRLIGYQIGAVRYARLRFDGHGRPYTLATVALYPDKLGVTVPPTADPAALRAATDGAVRRLLALGYRARLTQSPPFVGSHGVVLAPDRGGGPRTLLAGDPPFLPSAAGGGVDDLSDQAGQLLTKLNGVPIEQIGRNVRDLTAHLSAITGSPELHRSLKNLDATLDQVHRITAEVRPKIGPLTAKLDQAAGEAAGAAAAARTAISGEGAGQDEGLPDAIRQLTEAGRSLRSLADYLGRHPESLVRGKAKEK